ncbi:MAG: DNA primase [Schaalia hyovaginalis]|uniref:DNA primase n=1 Tax=Schaalia TaxID=2529408 RepID=UPI0026EEF52D|nr:DNA primase [Schaalia hyovaginalis]MCI6411576.1 DNA primase [Schaalia hyovaginalis]MCI6557283.1 DNA primase [Schaalia hyovaginalis]MCI7512479.1 DNA primase [Schaalia hyovaginalis]MDD7554876.1 DNA primase [Schaalia hyovaginalis]MDY3094544.1 DNA primase [Schaalia hyovaginalis]
MTEESGLALERLIAAFHEHYLIARAGDQADAESLVAAEEALRDAFFTYDDELFTRFGVELPFDLLDDEFDDEEDDLEEEEAEDGDDDFIDVDD